jgi:hypothetical protein
MKIALFTTQAEKGDLINLFALNFGSHTVMTSTGKDIDFILNHFRDADKAVMILTEKQVTGYRLPADTMILFSQNFPEGAIRYQAAARKGL